MEIGIARAEEMGLAVGIAVVDAGGYLVGCLRMEKARLLSCDIAMGKASAAALWRESGTELGKRWAPGAAVPAAASARVGGRFVPHQGGLPIWEGDEVIGGVGVSGAAASQDEEIALAALKAIERSGTG